MKNLSVCFLSRKRNGTLYPGAASNQGKRIYEHKNNLARDLALNTWKFIGWFGKKRTSLQNQLLLKEKQLKKEYRALEIELQNDQRRVE